MKIINGQLIKLTEEEAREEFNNLLYDDSDFEDQWGCNDEKQQEKNFYEWCSVYEDTNHLKKGKKV